MRKKIDRRNRAHEAENAAFVASEAASPISQRKKSSLANQGERQHTADSGKKKNDRNDLVVVINVAEEPLKNRSLSRLRMREEQKLQQKETIKQRRGQVDQKKKEEEDTKQKPAVTSGRAGKGNRATSPPKKQPRSGTVTDKQSSKKTTESSRAKRNDTEEKRGDRIPSKNRQPSSPERSGRLQPPKHPSTMQSGNTGVNSRKQDSSRTKGIVEPVLSSKSVLEQSLESKTTTPGPQETYFSKRLLKEKRMKLQRQIFEEEIQKKFKSKIEMSVPKNTGKRQGPYASSMNTIRDSENFRFDATDISIASVDSSVAWGIAGNFCGFAESSFPSLLSSQMTMGAPKTETPVSGAIGAENETDVYPATSPSASMKDETNGISNRTTVEVTGGSHPQPFADVLGSHLNKLDMLWNRADDVESSGDNGSNSNSILDNSVLDLQTGNSAICIPIPEPSNHNAMKEGDEEDNLKVSDQEQKQVQQQKTKDSKQMQQMQPQEQFADHNVAVLVEEMFQSEEIINSMQAFEYLGYKAIEEPAAIKEEVKMQEEQNPVISPASTKTYSIQTPGYQGHKAKEESTPANEDAGVEEEQNPVSSPASTRTYSMQTSEYQGTKADEESTSVKEDAEMGEEQNPVSSPASTTSSSSSSPLPSRLPRKQSIGTMKRSIDRFLAGMSLWATKEAKISEVRENETDATQYSNNDMGNVTQTEETSEPKTNENFTLLRTTAKSKSIDKDDFRADDLNEDTFLTFQKNSVSRASTPIADAGDEARLDEETGEEQRRTESLREAAENQSVISYHTSDYVKRENDYMERVLSKVPLSLKQNCTEEALVHRNRQVDQPNLTCDMKDRDQSLKSKNLPVSAELERKDDFFDQETDPNLEVSINGSLNSDTSLDSDSKLDDDQENKTSSDCKADFTSKSREDGATKSPNNISGKEKYFDRLSAPSYSSSESASSKSSNGQELESQDSYQASDTTDSARSGMPYRKPGFDEETEGSNTSGSEKDESLSLDSSNAAEDSFLRNNPSNDEEANNYEDVDDDTEDNRERNCRPSRNSVRDSCLTTAQFLGCEEYPNEQDDMSDMTPINAGFFNRAFSETSRLFFSSSAALLPSSKTSKRRKSRKH